MATGEDTNGEYAMWEATVPPGGGPPPHVHGREEEGFFILEGEITFTVNGERVVATAGSFANMPVGTPHSFKNESGQPAKMLISVAPAGLERMFFEVGTLRLLGVGLLWAVLTVQFEIGLGRLVLGLPWERITEDYDVTRGGFMGPGLLVMAASPRLAAWLRGSPRRR
jgi:quercetin dioxygenase-like cupin family protein